MSTHGPDTDIATESVHQRLGAPTWARRAVAFVGTAALAVGLVSAVAAPASAATVQSVTFAYTGQVQTFTVPAGVTQLSVLMDGAGGGHGGATANAGGGNAGRGGELTATLAVSPGEVLTVMAGGGGQDGDAEANHPDGVGIAGAGGTGGTADIPMVGGSGGVPGDLLSSGGAGGGAASFLASGGTVLLAAGGGAGGGGSGGAYRGGDGGNATRFVHTSGALSVYDDGSAKNGSGYNGSGPAFGSYGLAGQSGGFQGGSAASAPYGIGLGVGGSGGGGGGYYGGTAGYYSISAALGGGGGGGSGNGWVNDQRASGLGYALSTLGAPTGYGANGQVTLSYTALTPTVTLTSSAAQVRVGDPLTITARVADQTGAPVTTGSVVMLLISASGGGSLLDCGFTTPGGGFSVSGTPDATGTVTCQPLLNYVTPGYYTVQADYVSDPGTIAAYADLTEIILPAKLATATELTASASAPVSGQPITLTALVGTPQPGSPDPAPISGSALAATGTVSFTDGGTDLCGAVTVVPGGIETCTVAASSVGSHDYQATYSGDGTYLGSTATLALATAPAPTVPGAPVIGKATAGNASATVTWTAPISNGGSPVTGYSVRVFNAAGVQVGAVRLAPGGASGVVVTGLTNGVAYRVQVSAINVVGTSTPSALSSAVTPATTPPAPVIKSAFSGTAGGAVTATARWAAPGFNGGAAITGYKVRAQRVNAAGTVLSTTTSAVQPATGRALAMTLPAGTYRFTVVAINAAGTGARSAGSNWVTAR